MTKISGHKQRITTSNNKTLVVMRKILQNTYAARVPEAAAGLAYYALFSLFPFLLVLVSVGGFFVGREEVFRRTIEAVSQALPVSPELIERNFEIVLEKRGQIGLIGIVASIWSASSAFSILAKNINLAWTASKRRHYVKRRLLGFAMIGTLGALLMLSLLSTAVFKLLPQFNIPDNREDLKLFKQVLVQTIKYGVPLFITWLMFIALYRWVPNTRVKWKAAMWGAGFSAVVWELAKGIFARYLQSGWARYEVVYGSLGTLVAFLFWVYIGANIILYGAHLSAVLDEEMMA